MKCEEKMRKTVFIIVIVFAILGFYNQMTYAGPTGKEIGSVECIKRMMSGNDTIKVIRVDDPDNPFVSIFFTTIKSGQLFAMADPSNTSIAARLTGTIPVDEDGKRIIDTSFQTNIASISKSIGSKVMKIARMYDKEKDTLVYLVYTTKMFDGSLKHSMSVVPLGSPLSP
jgi:CreA protein